MFHLVRRYESRASQAENVNHCLVTIINELRRERAAQLGLVRARSERERSMAVDMRAFASSAHAALDEKVCWRQRCHETW